MHDQGDVPMTKRMSVLSLAAWLLAAVALPVKADELSPASFDRLHQLIRPGDGESLWLTVPWLTSIWEARQRAAAEGKPILIWSGGGSAPIGGC
jgi:hypothetical protein